MSGLIDLLDLTDVLLVENEEVFGVMTVADYFGQEGCVLCGGE
jgi:hypothetical protein